MRSLCLVVLLVAVPSLTAFAQDAGAAAPPAAAPTTPVAEPVAALTAADYAAKLDELWKTRDDPASMKQIDATITDGLKANATSYDLLWRAARYRWFIADGTTEEKLKRQIAKEGWNFADRAQKAKPGAPEGRYYTALSIGAYSQAVGILKALGEGLEGQFNENLDTACKDNEPFDRYGCHTAKGRYYWELPWPKRDLTKSREELKKVLAKHPEHIRTWLFLAETELKDGNPKEAKAAMDQVMSRGIDFDPPEGRRIKRWAKPVSEKIDEALK